MQKSLKIWGCLKLVTISCYNVTTLQHLFVVTNTVTTFISCNSIISTHNCNIQIFVVISKYLLLQRQRKVVTQIFVVTMSVRLSPVLVSCPLKLGGVGMTCAHVLGLQMLHLGEDVEPACTVCSRHV